MTAARPAIGSPCRSSGGRAVALFAYGRMKSPQRISDAGSIPASSTTTGLHGFDGMNSCDGRPAMVPAASGSAKESGVRCDGPISQTPMTAFITWRRLRDDPAARVGTKGRHLYHKAPRHCEATQTTGGPLAGADTFPGSARGPGVAAFKSTAAAPVFTEPVEVWNEPTHRH